MFLSRNQLKLIALLTMVIDHTGYFLLDNAPFWRFIGRISFPLFVYLTIDGCSRTRSLPRYASRMLFAWILSIVPFSLAFYHTWVASEQNIFLSLFLIIALFTILDTDSFSVTQKGLGTILLALTSVLCNASYDWYGIALAYLFYYDHEHGRGFTFLSVSCMTLVYVLSGQSVIQLAAIFAVFLLPHPTEGFQKDSRPNKFLSWMVYVFYPLHLLFFAFLTI